LEKLGINLGFLIVQIINFAIIMVVLVAWIYKPLMKAMNNRREKIQQGLEDARIAADARANAEQDAARLIEEAQNKSAQIVREATEKAEAANRDFKRAGEAEIEKMRQSALADTAQHARRNWLTSAVMYPRSPLCRRAKDIGEVLDEKRQHALVNEFFSGIKSGKVVVLQDVDLQGKDVEVTSALPLTEDERKTVSQDVISKFGKDAKVVYSVKPEFWAACLARRR
jgi:F-type H+-transporting ATPase subunit b